MQGSETVINICHNEHISNYLMLWLYNVFICFAMCRPFSDRPITYLYNTLHYYENKLRERPNLKRRLVVAVIMSQQEIRPQGWALTEAYRQYLARPPDDITWNPELSYYTALVRRLVNSILFTFKAQYLLSDRTEFVSITQEGDDIYDDHNMYIMKFRWC